MYVRYGIVHVHVCVHVGFRSSCVLVIEIRLTLQSPCSCNTDLFLSKVLQSALWKVLYDMIHVCVPEVDSDVVCFSYDLPLSYFPSSCHVFHRKVHCGPKTACYWSNCGNFYYCDYRILQLVSRSVA